MKRVNRCLPCLLGVLALAHAISVLAEQPHGPNAPGLRGLLEGHKPASTKSQPELSEIAARLDELAKRSDAGPALGAIEHGRRALVTAQAALGAGRMKLAERSKQIAWAALALASRRIAAANAARVRAWAEQRATEAEAALASARHALEAEAARLASLRAGAR